MSAETLRKAAALMRERAEAAAKESGQIWHNALALPGYAWLEPAHIGLHGYGDTAEHIASWHPAVALAVADWLDDTATFAAQEAEALDMPHLINAVDPYALAVARAYLGDPA